MADIGTSLEKTIEIYKKNWQKIIFASFLIYVPAIIATLAITFLFSADSNFDEETLLDALFSPTFGPPIAIIIFTLCLVYIFLYPGYLRYLNLCFTKESKLEEMLHFLKYRKLDTILFSIMFGIVILLVLSPLIIEIALWYSGSTASIVFAFFLLIVCCLALVPFSFSHIAYSIENLGPGAAIKRSFSLVKGNYFMTILFLIVYNLLTRMSDFGLSQMQDFFTSTIILIPLAIITLIISIFIDSFSDLWVISFYREMAKSQPQRARAKKK